MIQDKDLLSFFKDIEFMPPNNRDPREFINQPEDEETDEFTQADPTTQDHTDHPDPVVYTDYYMFTDPVARHGGFGNPKSQLANKLGKTYSNKDPETTHSFSDVHHTDLEQDAGEFPQHTRTTSSLAPQGSTDGDFPQHTGVRSMMEPSAAFNTDEDENNEVELERPTMIEGKVYPAGTRLYWKEG